MFQSNDSLITKLFRALALSLLVFCLTNTTAQAIEKPCAKESLRECEKYLVRAPKLIPMVTLSLTVTGNPQSGSAYSVEAVPHDIGTLDIRTDFSVDNHSTTPRITTHPIHCLVTMVRFRQVEGSGLDGT